MEEYYHHHYHRNLVILLGRLCHLIRAYCEVLGRKKNNFILATIRPNNYDLEDAIICLSSSKKLEQRKTRTIY